MHGVDGVVRFVLMRDLLEAFAREFAEFGPDDAVPPERFERVMRPLVARLVGRHGVDETNRMLARAAEETGIDLFARCIATATAN